MPLAEWLLGVSLISGQSEIISGSSAVWYPSRCPEASGSARSISRTSLRPLSSAPPQAIGKRLRRVPSGRRPGRQPGHKGQAQVLRPVEAVDLVIPVKPLRCHHCQQRWRGDDLPPHRPQVTESPLVKPVATADQPYRLVCPACGEASRAEVPAGVRLAGIARGAGSCVGCPCGAILKPCSSVGGRPKPVGKPGGSRRTRCAMEGIGCVTAPWPL
jgi:hypothetical protein